jgi:hypothetical protein
MTCGVKADQCGVLVPYIITFAHLELAPDVQIIPYIITFAHLEPAPDAQVIPNI